jgi:hypothetical protein
MEYTMAVSSAMSWAAQLVVYWAAKRAEQMASQKAAKRAA